MRYHILPTWYLSSHVGASTDNGQTLIMDIIMDKMTLPEISLEAGDCICMLSYNIWITKLSNIKQQHYVPKLMTQSQTTDAFT